MVFQGFYKNYLHISVEPLFQHYLYCRYKFDMVCFFFKFNKSVALLLAKSTIATILFEATLFL